MFILFNITKNYLPLYGYFLIFLFQLLNANKGNAFSICLNPSSSSCANISFRSSISNCSSVSPFSLHPKLVSIRVLHPVPKLYILSCIHIRNLFYIAFGQASTSPHIVHRCPPSVPRTQSNLNLPSVANHLCDCLSLSLNLARLPMYLSVVLSTKSNSSTIFLS